PHHLRIDDDFDLGSLHSAHLLGKCIFKSGMKRIILIDRTYMLDEGERLWWFLRIGIKEILAEIADFSERLLVVPEPYGMRAGNLAKVNPIMGRPADAPQPFRLKVHPKVPNGPAAVVVRRLLARANLHRLANELPQLVGMDRIQGCSEAEVVLDPGKIDGVPSLAERESKDPTA